MAIGNFSSNDPTVPAVSALDTSTPTANNNTHGGAVYGFSAESAGIWAVTAPGGQISDNRPTHAAGVWAEGNYGEGVHAESTGATGVYGHSINGIGVKGSSDSATGVYASGRIIGVFAQSPNVGAEFHCTTQPANEVFLSEPSVAAWFNGNVSIAGQVNKSATMFKIDHPVEPARKYLSHSAIESSDMKNVYDGVVILNTKGEAEVELPVWFDALNSDFRYQLTCIGSYAPVYIAEEIQHNSFKIAGGNSGMKISWQVTGIRQDAWAKAHLMQVEEDKSVEEQGYYIHPELHGEPVEKSIARLLHPHR